MKQFLLLLLILLASTLAPRAMAQDWKKLPPAPVTIHTAPYFINPDTGFVYSESLVWEGVAYEYFGNSTEEPGLWRTTNDGWTWTSVSGLASANITQVYFVNRTHGYASVMGPDSGVYATQDCGQTWTKLNVAGQFSGVYASGNSIFASSFCSTALPERATGPILHSSDNGSTWDTAAVIPGLTGGSGCQFVYGNRDSLVATVYPIPVQGDQGNFDYILVYSTDLGTHWTSTELSKMRSWFMSLFIPPHECTIYRERNEGCSDPWRSFYSADYPYSNWNLTFEEPGSNTYSSVMSVWMAGNGCTQYVPYTGIQSGVTPPMYRYAAQFSAMGWIALQETSASPSFVTMDSRGDYRNISVVGNGAIVYAADKDGNLWQTRNGGASIYQLDPLLSQPEMTFESGPIPQPWNVSTCEQDSFFVSYQNTACARAMLDSIWIEGLDAPEYSLTSSHHCSCSSTPDTTWFVLSAKRQGSRSLVVRARFVNDDFETFETGYTFSIDVSNSSQATRLESLPTSAMYGIPNCTAFDTVIIFTNPDKCNSLIITAVKDSGWMSIAGTPDLPDTLAAGGVLRVPVRVPPEIASAALEIAGDGYDSTFRFQIRRADPPMALESLPASSLSGGPACTEFDTTISFINPGICPLIIATIHDSGWTALGSSPDTIPSGGVLHVNVHIPSDVENTALELVGPRYDSTFRFSITHGAPSMAVVTFGRNPDIVAVSDRIAIPLYLVANATIVSTISIPFRFDTSVLEPIGFECAPGVVLAKPFDSVAPAPTVYLRIDSLLVQGLTLIGNLHCQMYLADTLATSLSVEPAGITVSDPGCLTLSADGTQANITLNGCTDALLLDFMRSGVIPFDIAPNPASSVIRISSRFGPAVFDCQLFDALGISRKRWVALDNHSDVDISSIPAGVYYIRAVASDGRRLTRKLIIAR